MESKIKNYEICMSNIDAMYYDGTYQSACNIKSYFTSLVCEIRICESNGGFALYIDGQYIYHKSYINVKTRQIYSASDFEKLYTSVESEVKTIQYEFNFTAMRSYKNHVLLTGLLKRLEIYPTDCMIITNRFATFKYMIDNKIVAVFTMRSDKFCIEVDDDFEFEYDIPTVVSKYFMTMICTINKFERFMV